ncbi:LOW QUALITY PROTEIN: hypothetical protein RJ641_023506 [Dillenia turbinata]|uniref:Uncharacterized protein n=1 Tax=Dillenia turbinata TaxID=194707 RepID=A0AAN8UIX8_9MAGN
MKTRVEAHSKLTQVSSTPVKPSNIHPLSILDQPMGLHTLHMVLYHLVSPFKGFDLDPLKASLCEALSNYPPVTGRLTRDDDGNCVGFDLDPLRASLCEALSNYPPVTGRLTRDDDGNCVVKCNDAGVRVLRAAVFDNVLI